MTARKNLTVAGAPEHLGGVHGDELRVKMCVKIAELIRVIDKLFREHYTQNILFQSLKKQWESQQATNAKLKADNETITAQNVALYEETETLKASLLDKERKWSECERNFSKTINDLTTQNETLKQELSTLRDTNETLNRNLSNATSCCRSCLEYRNKVDVLQSQIESQASLLDKEKEDLITCRKEMNERLKLMEADKEKLYKELTSIQSMSEDYQKENEKLKSTIHELQTKLKIYQTAHKPSTASKQSNPLITKQKHDLHTYHDKRYWLQSASIHQVIILVM